MSKLIEVPMVNTDRSLVNADPKQVKAAIEIHGAEAAERAAVRAKDVKALENAVTRKLEAQRDFAQGYRGKFRAGRPNSDRTVGITSADYCASFGFSERTVERWAEKLLDEARFEIEKHERLLKAWQIVEMQQAANYSSETVQWYTPEKYIEGVREVLGQIDLDPASSPEANEVVQAKEFYTSDGLEKGWHGRVFLNPPYGVSGGESVAGLFCHKAVHEFKESRVTAAIILVNSLHSQQWQKPLYSFPICFVDHRIRFVSGDGEENRNPTFQNIFVYLGPHSGKFAEVFSKFGYVMVPHWT